MWIWLCLLGLQMPGLEPVFVFGDLDEDDLAGPADAVFFDGKLFLVDREVDELIIVDPGTREIRRFGRQGGGPTEFKNWPDRMDVTTDGEVLVWEWNDWRLHRFTMDGEHRGMTAQTAEEKRWRTYGDFRLRLRHRPEILERDGSWISKSGHIFGHKLERHALYNLAIRHSMITIGEDGVIGIMDHAGQISLYEQTKEIGHFTFPVEHLKDKVRVDPLRSKFLEQMGEPNQKAYLNGVPILDFAMRDRHRIWALAKDEHFNNEYEGPQKVWLYTADFFKPAVEKVFLPFEPNQIRYQKGHLLMISRENATVHVFKVTD